MQPLHSLKTISLAATATLGLLSVSLLSEMIPFASSSAAIRASAADWSIAQQSNDSYPSRSRPSGVRGGVPQPKVSPKPAPPRSQKPAQSAENDFPAGSRPSGVRGDCPTELATIQTLLFQNQQNGQIVSGRPTFLWHLSADSLVPVRFTLVDTVTGSTLIDRTYETAQAKAGVMQAQLPADASELVVGRKYLWSVALVCNPNDRSKNPVAQGQAQRVAASPELTRQLAAANSAAAKAQIYAQQGLWYDALATIWFASSSNPKDRTLQEQLLAVLTQMGQTGVAKLEKQRLSSLPPAI